MKNPRQTSIIGSAEVSRSASPGLDKDAVYQTNSRFWNEVGSDVLGTTALPLYGAFVSEERLGLFGDVSGQTLLEIGCGNGRSLQYLGERGAAELWGMDISPAQLEKTKQNLAAYGLSATLVCAPMEEYCGIPADYFDCVYSVYAIGWTHNLDETFRRIASYLKKGGSFIFSWSHPIHKCVVAENSALIFQKCYFDESRYALSLGGETLTLSDYKLSTYINALARAGFVVEQMTEESDDEILQRCDTGNAFAQKAKMLPVTFVIKARKP